MSCNASKNMTGTYSETDFRGKITQIKHSDIKELNFSECSGYVIDHESTERIPFATIYLKNNIREYKSNTDKTGNFTFKEIIGGKYQIQVYFIGYYPFKDSVNIEIGKITDYQIELQSDTEFKL